MAEPLRAPLARAIPWVRRHPSLLYVTPFLFFLLLLALGGVDTANATWEPAARCLAPGLVCWLCWPRELSLRPGRWLAGAALGAAVFVVWIAPDVLVPQYRTLWVFQNAFAGHVHASLPAAERASHWVLFWRITRAVIVVPFIEELFWRAWLMRWLISTHFEEVPLGRYTAWSFWAAAVLFASEHGPYWDVGLAAGIVYNWWMLRTRSVADCVWIHAVTNACLSIFVLTAHQWQYWQ